MIRARSVAGPLRRAHPASGATWNVQVVKGKMSSQCLWHACRALSAGLLLMLLGSAMAVIGYYADILSVAQEIRGNATVSVKDEARGFHLNNLSYAGPIVMGFGGFIVVAACVMTFEARDSAAKVTPARPQSLSRPVTRRTGCAAPARLDQLGVYRLPHVLPLPHQLPLAPVHYRHRPQADRGKDERGPVRARFGSAPDLRGSSLRAPSASALRRPLRRYALSVDEPPHSAICASAAESECGSQSSLALDLHGAGASAGVTLRVRDNTRRRPLARQPRLRDDMATTPVDSTYNIHSIEEGATTTYLESIARGIEIVHLSVEHEIRARSAPLDLTSCRSPPVSPRLVSALSAFPLESSVLIEQPEAELIEQESETEETQLKEQDNIKEGYQYQTVEGGKEMEHIDETQPQTIKECTSNIIQSLTEEVIAIAQADVESKAIMHVDTNISKDDDDDIDDPPLMDESDPSVLNKKNFDTC